MTCEKELFDVLHRTFDDRRLTIGATKDGEIAGWETFRVEGVGMFDVGDVYFLGGCGLMGHKCLAMKHVVALADKGKVSFTGDDGYYYVLTLDTGGQAGKFRDAITEILRKAYVGRKLTVKLFEHNDNFDSFSFVVTHIRMDDDFDFHPYGEGEFEEENDRLNVVYAVKLADKGYLGTPESGGCSNEYTLEMEE